MILVSTSPKFQGIATLYGDGKPFGEVPSPAGGDERTPALVVMQRHRMAMDRPPAESL